MMEVFLLNPPCFPKYSRSQRSPGVIRSGTLYYPLWLAYATGVLEQSGHRCRLVDAPADGLSLENCLKRAQAQEPGLIVVDTSTPSIASDLEAARALKGQHPKACVVLVGAHASATAADLLGDEGTASFVDFIAKEEYDDTLRDLAAALEAGRDPREVAGLYFRDGAEARLSGARPYIENLDALPFVSQVYQRHLDYTKYFYSITQYPVVTIITGRGCPYQCTFCQYPQTMHGHTYRYRSAENVAQEFAWIEANLPNVKEVFIEDDTLTVNRERVRRLAEALIEQGSRLSWTANSRCDVDEETLHWMKRAGCRLLCVGVESGNDEILKNIRKRLTVERVRRFARDAKKAGIMIHGCFMVGNPGETKETMEETFQLAKELDFDTVQFFPLMVYPGTAAYEWAVKNNYLTTRDFSQWVTEEGTHHCVVSRPGLSNEELVAFCHAARRRYYLRPSYMLAKLKQVIVQPAERRRILKASRTFFKYLAKNV